MVHEKKGQTALEAPRTAHRLQHGQAALDFLLTYGWALALVGIVVAIFFVLGVFDISNFMGNKAVGFSDVAVKNWRMNTNGTFSLILTSHATQNINITNVSIAIDNQTSQINATVGKLAIGASSRMLSTASRAFDAQPAGTGYVAKVSIDFIDMDTGFAQSSTGTLVGKVI